MKGDQMRILVAYPDPAELPLSNQTRFKVNFPLPYCSRRNAT